MPSPHRAIDILLMPTREKAHEGIKEVVKPFDWSYTTDYKGTVTKGKQFDATPQQTAEPIPIELLKRPDPILFFEEVVLYESELDDNGISILSCKLRVMPDRMLLLCRLFLRLDNVIVRIRDTRIYVEFATSKVIRDYTEKEDTFDKVKRVSLFHTGLYEETSNKHLESLILWKIAW
jgi:type 2A phosphatase activator TIP41